MKRRNKVILAAGMLAGAAALTGCTANTAPVSTATPQASQKQTAEPQNSPQTSPDASAEAAEDETPAPIQLRVDGKETSLTAIEEENKLLLPLMGTGEALGWTAESESMEEESWTRRTISLTKDESRITVTWLVSDNTASQITWQKDGLLIPVDTLLTTLEDIVYVPAAFFEEAANVTVNRADDAVEVQTKESAETPPMQQDDKK